MAVQAELIDVVKDGPGAYIIMGAYADTSVIERTTDVLGQIVESEKTTRGEISERMLQDTIAAPADG